MKCLLTGKIRYRTPLDAMIILARIRDADRTDRLTTEIRHYQCSRCKGWHLTSQEQRS